ncbi:unnamed protein product [Ambrosiozyma monospora]|uniref:Unnamed protein product n=1 Tax=Ambrosiozyma monospora TaxID=43982 RepID=A0ACB5U7T4_AMBMO|nr:unnamed protein product [Ambrosiozyma monospora]
MDQHSKKNKRTKELRAGYGVFFGDGDKRNIAAPLLGDKHDNNVAELTAVDKALDEVIKDVFCAKYTIATDSHYCMNL